MKVAISYILYVIGDALSWFLRYDCFSWVYPAYKHIMLTSSKLDTGNKIWKAPKEE